MEKLKEIKANVAEFPEETTADGIRLYGETSMDNCLAVLTHYIHNPDLREKLTANQLDDIRVLVEDILRQQQPKAFFTYMMAA